jgi:signal transduction histidine kinase
MGEPNIECQEADGIQALDLSLQDIIDSVEDAVVVMDSAYRVLFANLAVRSRFQKGTESPIGKHCYEIFRERDKPCSPPLWDCPLREVLKSGSGTIAYHPVHIHGAERYFKITMYPLRDNYGNTKAVVELMRDATTERELESQILRRHHQLLALNRISSAVSGLWDLDAILRVALDNVLEVINGTIGGILLVDDETNTLSYRVQRGLSARYAEKMRMPVGDGIAGKVAQTGNPMLLEDISKEPETAHHDLVSAEGLKGFVSIPLKAKDKVLGVMNIASHAAGRFGKDDMSLLSSIGGYIGIAIEQARLYERLMNASERYQTLLQHALTAQEEERKRIARELHDETSQSLTSLTLSLQAIRGIAETKGIRDADLMERLKETHAYAVHAGKEIVRLMKELRPTLLDELGLPVAIHRYAKDTLQVKGINVAAEFVGTERRFPPEVEITLFRVAQGAIGNILEHSGAKNASVKLECSTNKCVLHIEDDGKGFDVNKLMRVDPSGRGAGLFTIKERVKLIGGTCSVESRPGQGTKVTVNVPLTRNRANEKDKGTNSR